MANYLSWMHASWHCYSKMWTSLGKINCKHFNYFQLAWGQVIKQRGELSVIQWTTANHTYIWIYLFFFFFCIAFTFSKCHSTFCTQLSGYNGHENSLFYLDWPVHFATKIIKAIKKTHKTLDIRGFLTCIGLLQSVNHNVSVPANFSS